MSDIAFLWKAASSWLVLWPTACEWYCTLCERQSHDTFFDQQKVSTCCGKAVSSHLFLWPTASEYIACFVKGSLTTSFSMTNSWWVTLHTILWKIVSWHLCKWLTASEWHCTFWERDSHQIFSDDQQQVSDIAHFVQGSLIVFSYEQQDVSDITHFVKHGLTTGTFLWPPASECHCTSWGNLIFSYDQQQVCDIAHFVTGNLITSFHLTNSLWVTAHFIQGSLITITSFPVTNSLWVTLHVCEKQSSHIFYCDQQEVSDIAHLSKVVSLHLALWATASEWHVTFCQTQSHCIFSYDYQQVSDIAHCVKGSLITSFPTMTTSESVTLHNVWTPVSSHLFWPTGSEWHCTFCKRQSCNIFPCNEQEVNAMAHFVNSILTFSYAKQLVSDIALCVNSSLITCFPMMNRLWVTFHIFWKAVSSHVLLWPTGSEWHCTFFERQSQYIFLWPTGSEWYCTFHEKQSCHISSQLVGDIAHLVKGIVIISFLLSTASEWHWTFCSERKSHHIFPMTNRK